MYEMVIFKNYLRLIQFFFFKLGSKIGHYIEHLNTFQIHI